MKAELPVDQAEKSRRFRQLVRNLRTGRAAEITASLRGTPNSFRSQPADA